MSDLSEDADGWLHIGTGAFHRAHQAFYLDRLNALGLAPPWRLTVGNIKPDLTAVEDTLRCNGGRFHLETATPDGRRTIRPIQAITAVIDWRPDLRALVDAGADPSTRIISFTVTEAGYHIGPDGGVDPHSPELADDLACGRGATIYGAVARMLHARMARGLAGVTLLCCDNIRENGLSFRRRLFDVLTRRGQDDLKRWTEACCTFPNAMVDRITPRADAELRARVLAATEIDDPAAVMAEDSVQWVIEDDFARGRPALERVGVQFVGDVTPYEDAKIRVLNASHALLAWRGAVLGLEYIHTCVAAPDLRDTVIRYVTDDVMACLPDSPVDLGAYRHSVLERFGNPHIRDTVARVAADGFAKIAGWVRPTIQQRLDAGGRPEATARLALSFLSFLRRWREGGIDFTYTDQTLKPQVVDAILSAADPVTAFACEPDLWEGLAGRADLVALFREIAARSHGGEA